MKKLPAHGRPSRYKTHGCRCMACCVRVNKKEKFDGPPSWPARYLLKEIDERILVDDFGHDTVEQWKKDGIEDFHADRVAIHYKTMPSKIWPGYYEAADVYNEVTK
jgi:hypothetical protein